MLDWKDFLFPIFLGLFWLIEHDARRCHPVDGRFEAPWSGRTSYLEWERSEMWSHVIWERFSPLRSWIGCGEGCGEVMCYQGMPILESGESRALWKAFTVLKRGPLVSSDSALGMVMRAGGAETPSHGWLTHLSALHPVAPPHSSEVLNCKTDEIWWCEWSMMLKPLLQTQATKRHCGCCIWENAFNPVISPIPSDACIHVHMICRAILQVQLSGGHQWISSCL